MKKVSILVLLLSFVFTGAVYADVADLTGLMTVDSAFELFISDDDTVEGYQLGGYFDDWMTPVNVSAVLDLGTTYLHVKARDFGGIAGFLGNFSLNENTSFVFQNGTKYLTTNVVDWKVSRTGFGLAYETPTLSTGLGSTGLNDGLLGSSWGIISGIDTQAGWIWTNNGMDLGTTRYFSTRITTTPEPVSATLFLLGVS